MTQNFAVSQVVMVHYDSWLDSSRGFADSRFDLQNVTLVHSWEMHNTMEDDSQTSHLKQAMYGYNLQQLA